MKIYGLVGKAGTGKSHNALLLTDRLHIDAIIDDGLLIYHGIVKAGYSAKFELTALAAVRRAVFTDNLHRDEVKSCIQSLSPSSILVVGTSKRMVNQICDRLELHDEVEFIAIEDVSSPEAIERASSLRSSGMHAIPVLQAKLQSSTTLSSVVRRIRERMRAVASSTVAASVSAVSSAAQAASMSSQHTPSAVAGSAASAASASTASAMSTPGSSASALSASASTPASSTAASPAAVESTSSPAIVRPLFSDGGIYVHPNVVRHSLEYFLREHDYPFTVKQLRCDTSGTPQFAISLHADWQPNLRDSSLRLHQHFSQYLQENLGFPYPQVTIRIVSISPPQNQPKNRTQNQPHNGAQNPSQNRAQNQPQNRVQGAGQTPGQRPTKSPAKSPTLAPWMRPNG